ncbi:L,D-transpeptidase family protein [Uliginosibacterium aquaticum]|uniref:L,D-transpeptidase n=1 Tax=Uliginosibacterium aquaticum TaxID=2731212 RepID=A0ABX2IJ70_9RHOO|nr:L,D-transpeptidase [Uliginosibacterium aquaticum]NSL55047.1 L,D-transpeptidase [Uliginosibacterium aquaticum]
MDLRVSIKTQSMTLYDAAGATIRRYAISTAALGVGEKAGSYQTPRGQHLVRAKIGGGQPQDAVFKGRRPTGEVWTPRLHAQFPERDWILSRIMWLSGTEVGCNRLGSVDSMRRYIYIHGTPDSEPMGVPVSHGCIRMRNRDVIELFDLVPVGTLVLIEA